MLGVSSLSSAGVGLAAPAFLVATVVVVLVAPRLTATVDDLSARTSFGATVAGSVLLGASTSLPGIIVTVVATVRGDVALASANAVGGVVAQTTFLAVADLGNREQSVIDESVSPKALTQVAFLLLMLAAPLLAVAGWPDVTVGRIHPVSVVLVGVYVTGLVVARREPAGGGESPETARDTTPTSGLWRRYLAAVAAVGIAGYVIGTAISPIADSLGLTSIAAGALITAGVTSSPELVTALSASRRGRVRLAVGDIVGGNTFDILFLVVADAVLAASLYAGVGNSFSLLLGAAIVLNALVLLGFVRRDRGRAVSTESSAVLVIYVALAAVLLVAPPQ